MVAQGDVVWVDLAPSPGSEPGYRRPALVLQHDRFNRTKLATVVVVAITSKLKYGELPGNVRLRKGEAGLPRSSIVNVTQIAAIDRARIRSKLGSLSTTRLAQVWAGVRLVCEPQQAVEAAPD